MKPHSRFAFIVALTALGTTLGYLQMSPAAMACGVPLTVEDIQHGIMPSDENLPCTSNGGNSSGSSQQYQGPSQEEIQRQAERRARWERADDLNREANDALDRRDPEKAIALYKRSLALNRANGDRHNAAIVEKNLAQAQKEYAAIRDDDRVNVARSRYKDQNVYTKPNPFAAPAPPPANSQAKNNSNEDCYWDEHGRPCHPGNAAAAANPKAGPKDSLREQLKRSLESDDGPRDDPAPANRGEINTASKAAPPPAKPQDVEPAKTPPNRDDDPLKNYLNSDNRSGSLNNGTLTKRDPNFEMSGSETRHETERMQGFTQPVYGKDGSEVMGPPVPDEGQARK